MFELWERLYKKGELGLIYTYFSGRKDLGRTRFGVLSEPEQSIRSYV